MVCKQCMESVVLESHSSPNDFILNDGIIGTGSNLWILSINPLKIWAVLPLCTLLLVWVVSTKAPLLVLCPCRVWMFPRTDSAISVGNFFQPLNTLTLKTSYVLSKYIVFQFVSIASYLLKLYQWEESSFFLAPPSFHSDGIQDFSRFNNSRSLSLIHMSDAPVPKTSSCPLMASLQYNNILFVYRGVQEWSGKREGVTSLHSLAIIWLIQPRSWQTFFATRSQS